MQPTLWFGSVTKKVGLAQDAELAFPSRFGRKLVSSEKGTRCGPKPRFGKLLNKTQQFRVRTFHREK
jgi:hypothetical protein